MKLLGLVLSKWKKIATIVLFTLYCAFILWETLLHRSAQSSRTYELRLFWGFRDLITGEGNGGYVTLQYFQNILFFIPFGFLYPCKKKWWVPVLSAFIVSSSIEFTQYVTARGLCELDDVIANTIGSLLGFCVYVLISRIVRKKQGGDLK